MMLRILTLIFCLSLSKLVSLEDKEILFKNSYVTCYTDRLVIAYYYFPFGDKTIQYKNIRSLKLLGKNDFNFFQIKSWGMGLSPIWWHLDMHRAWRQHFIIFDANQWPKIGLTMNDNDTLTVYYLIKKTLI